MADQSEEKKEYSDSCGFVNYKAQAGDLWLHVILCHLLDMVSQMYSKYHRTTHSHTRTHCITLHIPDLTPIMDI